jgi:hypothetical protein
MFSLGPQPATLPEFTHSSLPENPVLHSSVCAKCGKLIAVSAEDDKLKIVERTHRCT